MDFRFTIEKPLELSSGESMKVDFSIFITNSHKVSVYYDDQILYDFLKGAIDYYFRSMFIKVHDESTESLEFDGVEERKSSNG